MVFINSILELKNGIDSSKVFYFNTNDIGFKKSIDQVSSTIEDLKKKLATKGTLREKYIENSQFPKVRNIFLFLLAG